MYHGVKLQGYQAAYIMVNISNKLQRQQECIQADESPSAHRLSSLRSQYSESNWNLLIWCHKLLEITHVLTSQGTCKNPSKYESSARPAWAPAPLFEVSYRCTAPTYPSGRMITTAASPCARSPSHFSVQVCFRLSSAGTLSR